MCERASTSSDAPDETSAPDEGLSELTFFTPLTDQVRAACADVALAPAPKAQKYPEKRDGEGERFLVG